MKAKAKQWRRLNPYACIRCGKNRFTLRFSRKKDGICTVCQRREPLQDGPTLFNETEK